MLSSLLSAACHRSRVVSARRCFGLQIIWATMQTVLVAFLLLEIESRRRIAGCCRHSRKAVCPI